ncbi:hypothetical protein EB796_019211 [Bugula neritina]|uniref:Uncharacterized protein n=1 Tax=Bugula neritina TaxID=10212 RepID=A0A7J7JAR9_BUGNE|nr:hypothetical protein EB796_019211 [Bugula neritina]
MFSSSAAWRAILDFLHGRHIMCPQAQIILVSTSNLNIFFICNKCVAYTYYTSKRLCLVLHIMNLDFSAEVVAMSVFSTTYHYYYSPSLLKAHY